jgi:lipopolysaccharide/colanic/teichoic acid biosynthesis glycosyltransferase
VGRILRFVSAPERHSALGAEPVNEAIAAEISMPEARAGAIGKRQRRDARRRSVDEGAKRVLELVIALVLLALAAPLFAAIALAIKLDSRGPVFYRCRRVGFRGREIAMVKFRKMKDGATGSALTVAEDDRFTGVGRVLARTKLDELPQLWNVLKGEMSLVGPRPEDPTFVEARPKEYARILEVRPGMTGLCQLAFANEAAILDATDRVGDYVARLLPQKVVLDMLYASRRSLSLDFRILLWTVLAVVAGCEVAIDPTPARLTMRRAQKARLVPAASASSAVPEADVCVTEGVA